MCSAQYATHTGVSVNVFCTLNNSTCVSDPEPYATYLKGAQKIGRNPQKEREKLALGKQPFKYFTVPILLHIC
jgi:hypothetical protein